METASPDNKLPLLDGTKARFSNAMADAYQLDEALEVALQILDRGLKNTALQYVALESASQGKRDFSFEVVKLMSDGPEKTQAVVHLLAGYQGPNEPFSDRVRELIGLLGTTAERQEAMEPLLEAYILRGAYNDAFSMARMIGRELSETEVERLLHKTKERLQRARKNSL